MKKVILIPDSFKGNISSSEICDIMEGALRVHFNDIEIVKIPVADGGEGSCDSFLAALPGEKIFTEVNDPYFRKIQGFYGLLENGNTAVIEMAAASGLPLAEGRLNPKVTTTYGVGELILDAINHGAKKIIMGLGGSSTNDCGVGCFAALGTKFYNRQGDEFIPTGGTLAEVRRIDVTNLKKNINGIEFVTMCDIDNPLYGKNGAAYVFAPQKGADEIMVKDLDRNLMAFAETVEKNLGFSDVTFAGAGAAGGMGFGMKAFLNSKMQMGIDTILDTVKFDDLAGDADLILSGEGKMDTQSLRGKVVIGIARHAKELNVPLIAVVGDIGDNIDDAYEMGVTAVYSINRVAKSFECVKSRAKDDLRLTIDTLARTIKQFEK